MGGNILASRDFCAYLEIDFKESLGGKEIITQKDLDAFIKLIKSRFDRFLEKFKDDPLQLRRILWFKKKFSDFCEKEIIEKVKKSQQVSASEFGYEKIYTLTSLDDEEKFQYFKFALENSINAGKMVLYNAK